MRLFILLIFLIGIQHHSQQEIGYKQITRQILIINSFNAESFEARRNKKELFAALADSLKYIIKDEFAKTQNKEIVVIPELITTSPGNDSIYIKIINKSSGAMAIVIKDLNTYFEQTGVEVTKEAGSKTRVASYNINSDITYQLYDTTGKIKESEIRVSEFFSERNVVSGLFAAGPDIVAKRKHAFKIIQKNAIQYVRDIKPYLE